MIDEGKFHPGCIYNMDEAGLMYRMPPKSTFVAKQIKKARGRKADKARLVSDEHSKVQTHSVSLIEPAAAACSWF
ncbi:hypothetical protein E2C01_033499 [Portunus trituberculatus]|uniref:Uncharacterized protein n=1 Tax=Portunus trituberculatus TaxID=210409 RepID=A0A5B7F3L1_PORTR|nr:hypothetical protein [Portunus trituberculatus]